MISASLSCECLWCFIVHLLGCNYLIISHCLGTFCVRGQSRTDARCFSPSSERLNIMCGIPARLEDKAQRPATDAKLKPHPLRTQSLKVLHLKPGVGQYIAIHATLTARDFFLANVHLSGPFTCIFSKTSRNLFLCRLVPV